MEIIKIKKFNNAELYTVAGITICSIVKDYNFKSKNILNCFYKEKSFDNYTETISIKIFNKNIFEQAETPDYIETTYFKTITRKINKITETKRILEKIVDPKYNKIFILKSNLGEAYLFLKFLINELITNLDRPLIIATKKYHLDVINMLSPNIDCVYTDKLKLEVNDKLFKINDQTYCMVFPLKFYLDTEYKIYSEDTNYLKEMYNYFNISKCNKLNINKIKITDKTKLKINKFIQKNNLDNFVFISKDATTCKNIPKKFWDKLESKLNLKVVHNSKNFTIAEAYYLSKKSVCELCLRSGLSEILSEGNNFNIVLYTDFKKRYKFNEINANKILKGYSIKSINPDSRNIKEIIYDTRSEDRIIDEIVDTINKKDAII